MEGSGPNGGATRRLPSWMLAKQDTDAVSKPEYRVKKDEELNDGLGSESLSKRKPKNLALHTENEISKSRQGNVAEGKRSRGKRKISAKNAGFEGEIQESVAEEKESGRSAKGVRESAPRGRKRWRREPIPVPEDNNMSEITCAQTGDDDLDLTVEDLISIAYEYISANGDIEEQNFARKESINAISTAEPRSLQVSPVDAISCELKPPTSISENFCEAMTKEEIVVPIERTGDPAQDMLNLLLGPLLKKRANEEKKNEALPTNSRMFIGEVNQRQVSSVTGDTIPHPKKKTSLKDKIAMFLE